MAERLEGIDMSDFSSKAKKPKVPTLVSATDLVQCAGTLHALAERIYIDPVVRALSQLRTILQSQKSKWISMGSYDVVQLTRWINNRLFALLVAAA